jgi:hypothetical protein
MKKLRLNKEIISRLDDPQRIYGGGGDPMSDSPDVCAATLGNVCAATQVRTCTQPTLADRTCIDCPADTKEAKTCIDCPPDTRISCIVCNTNTL